jgi:site-specific recombinase XerD
METFIAMQRSAETRRAYMQDLRRWSTFSEGQVVDANLVVAFRDHLSATLAPRSAARTFSTVRTYHRWLVQQGQATVNPFDSMKGPKTTSNSTPKVPTDADVDALVESSYQHPTWRAVIALLLNGLRASEVGSLLYENITRGPEGIYMKVIGKGQKERLVPMTNEAWVALQMYWGPNIPVGPYALADVYNQPYSGHAVRNMVYECASKVKLKGMHPHALRHHYATRLIRAGANIMQVRDLLGHASVATTQVYVTLDLADLFEAARLDPRQHTDRKLRAVS